MCEAHICAKHIPKKEIEKKHIGTKKKEKVPKNHINTKVFFFFVCVGDGAPIHSSFFPYIKIK